MQKEGQQGLVVGAADSRSRNVREWYYWKFRARVPLNTLVSGVPARLCIENEARRAFEDFWLLSGLKVGLVLPNSPFLQFLLGQQHIWSTTKKSSTPRWCMGTYWRYYSPGGAAQHGLQCPATALAGVAAQLSEPYSRAHAPAEKNNGFQEDIAVAAAVDTVAADALAASASTKIEAPVE